MHAIHRLALLARAAQVPGPDAREEHNAEAEADVPAGPVRDAFKARGKPKDTLVQADEVSDDRRLKIRNHEQRRREHERAGKLGEAPLVHKQYGLAPHES